MIVRMLLLLLGFFHIVNGLFMLIAPAAWYASVPGVPATGSFNPHFILDIGMAFVASGAGLMLGARRNARAAIFAVAGATWPALHALIHIDGWLMHGFPTDTQIALSEAVGVVGLSALGVVLAWLRMRGRKQMIKSLLHRYLSGFERRYEYDATYLHELADISPRAFWRFASVQMKLQSKGDAPRDALQAAAIGGALVEDCGPCVQIASDRAVEAGMSGDTIKALLSGEPANADAQLGFDYARALLNGSENLNDLRPQIETRWGKRGLIALTFMAMAARNFPVLKRALGHAKTCQRVRVGNSDVAVQPSLKAA